MKLCAIDNQVVLEAEGTAIPVKSYKISSSAQGGTELEATIVVGINVMKAEIAAIQVPLRQPNLKAKSDVPLPH